MTKCLWPFFSFSLFFTLLISVPHLSPNTIVMLTENTSQDATTSTEATAQPISTFPHNATSLSLQPTSAPTPTTTSTETTDILQLPFEILAGHILAILGLSDLSRLARVCRHFYQLSQSNYLWQKKFFHDYPSYRPGKTLRQCHGWKRIYQAMDRVEVYTWGKREKTKIGGRKNSN